MKKYNSIINNINNYFKLCIASLESDMAKRIMYSVIPSVAQPEEIMGTKGVVDYKALDAAVEGRKDVLKYGIQACANECRHYNPFSYGNGKIDGRDLKDNIMNLFNQNNYIGALQKALKAFNDLKFWAESYGGKPWAKIAETLLKIAYLDKELAEIRDYKKKGPYEKWKSVDKEIQIKKNIVLLLNVFDGLAHNTASIMNNLIDLENQHIFNEKKSGGYGGYGGSYYINKLFNKIKEQKNIDSSILEEAAALEKQFLDTAYASEDVKIHLYEKILDLFKRALDLNKDWGESEIIFNKTIKDINYEINSLKEVRRANRIKRLMDAKELEESFDTYQEIKQSLVDSGDIHRFKDWVGKIESHPESLASNKEHRDAEIIFIKELKSNLESLNDIKKNKNIINNIINNNELLETYALSKLIEKAKNAINEIDYRVRGISWGLLFENVSDLKIKNILNSKLEKYQNKLKKLSYDIESEASVFADNFDKSHHRHNFYAGKNLEEVKKNIDELLISILKKVDEFIVIYSNLNFKKQ